MLILEVTSDPNIEKLAGISQFLIGRSNDTNSKKSVDIQTFLNLAAAQGISLTADRLKSLSMTPPLSNLIADVQGDESTGKVIFRGSDEEMVGDTMTVDQARATVDKMAKRALP